MAWSTSPGGGGGTPNFNSQSFGDAGGFLQALYSARQPFLAQQSQLLNTLGPSLRTAILGASPELSMYSNYLTSQFQQGLPKDLEADYADRIRTAQAARGFGGGGTGPAGEEARFLQGAADQRRMSLLGQLSGLGNNLLGISGLGAPPQLEFASLASAMLGSQRLNAETAAGQSQSRFAQQMYNDMLRGRIGGGGGGGSYGGGSAGGIALGGGSGGYGNAGDYSAIGFNPFDISNFVGFDPGYMAPGTYLSKPGLSTLPVSTSFNGIPNQALNPVIGSADNWAGTGKSYAELHPAGAGFGGW